MHPLEKIVHQLMVSQLSATADASVYARIVQAARRRNQPLGITGVLVFDGERFCHLIEGPEVSVAGVFGRIEQDPRHTALRVLHSGLGRSGHARSAWFSGYCDPHDLDLFAGSPALAGVQAMDRFLGLVSRCDLSS